MLLEIRSDQNVKLTQHFMSKLVAPKSKHYVYVYCIRCEISQVSNDYHKRWTVFFLPFQNSASLMVNCGISQMRSLIDEQDYVDVFEAATHHCQIFEELLDKVNTYNEDPRE